MGAIYEKIEDAICRIDLGIERLEEYQDELTNDNLNAMASLATKLQNLVFACVLNQSTGGSE